MRRPPPATHAQAGLRHYKSSAARASLAGIALVAVAIAVGRLSEDLAVPIGTFGTLMMGIGFVGLVRVWRIRRRVAQKGWRLRAAMFRVAPSRWGPNGQPALLLKASREEPEAVVSLSTTVFRWEALHGADELWVVGDPLRRFAAVATTDGNHVVVVKRPWLRAWRRHLRTLATS